MQEILTIVAMLSVENVFYRPKEKQAQADMKRAKFFQPEGGTLQSFLPHFACAVLACAEPGCCVLTDHLTLLTVYQSWAQNKFSNPWCFENFIQARQLKRAQVPPLPVPVLLPRFWR